MGKIFGKIMGNHEVFFKKPRPLKHYYIFGGNLKVSFDFGKNLRFFLKVVSNFKK